MSMQKSKYSANGMPSGVKPRMTPEGKKTGMDKSVKGETGKMPPRMERSFQKVEKDESTRKPQSGCME